MRNTISRKNSSWCLALINETRRRAKIVHIGRGKFKVISGDEEDTRYAGNIIIIDASDIFHCKD
jgi:hypothetical protein